MNLQTQKTLIAEAEMERAAMIKTFFARLFSRKSFGLAEA